MAMIGYSQLMKDIFDLDKSSVELLLERLAKQGLTDLRLRVLKQLAKSGRETVSGVLKQIRENNTGGTYKTIHEFFTHLEKEDILCVEKTGNRSYWKFSQKSVDLANYFNNS